MLSEVMDIIILKESAAIADAGAHETGQNHVLAWPGLAVHLPKGMKLRASNLQCVGTTRCAIDAS